MARPLRERVPPPSDGRRQDGAIADVDPAAKTVTCADGIDVRGRLPRARGGVASRTSSTRRAPTRSAFPLYALADAERLRSRIFEVFEDADRDPSLIAQGALNIVVVGGGPTGVETAGALADLVNDVMPGRYHDLDVDAAQVILVDPGAVVLAPFSTRAHEYAGAALQRKGVAPRARGEASPRSRADRVTLSDGREILTRTVVWAGGIQAAAARASRDCPLGHGGRVDVLPDLTVAGVPGRLRPRRRRPTSRAPTASRSRSSARSPCRPVAGRPQHPGRHRRASRARRSATATRASWR